MATDRLSDVSATATGRASRVSLIGESDAFKHLMFRIGEVAPTGAAVLLLGETGTGKSLIAQAIHERSPQCHERFVAVNCAALPPTLLEIELFGHEPGAFTDAKHPEIGRFELAHGGTIFLDEVGELPLETQAKLLRFLQGGEFERLGSHHTRHVSVRVVAATNRDMREEVKSGRFRRDLYLRLNVFPISIPPLRARRGDIPLLAHHLVAKLAERLGRRIDFIPGDVMEHLQRYAWPGNVRELENVLERAVIISRDGTLRLDRPDDLPVESPVTDALVEVERAHIRRILSLTGGRIEGEGGAARTLGLKPSTLRSRMRKLGIVRSFQAPRAESRRPPRES
jgi:transcriptional regulator with GAF, ATPase, and Fis domain